MSNWKRLYDERKWDDLWDWMRDDVEREDLVALYEQLKQDIRPISLNDRGLQPTRPQGINAPAPHS